MLTLIPKNKNKLVLAEYKQYNKLRLLSLIVIGLTLSGIWTGLFFIYNNIYLTISKTHSTFALNTTLGVEAIEFERYDKVKTAWEERGRMDVIEILRDPFHTIATTTTTEKLKK